jgi:hypothetical protein
MCHVCFYSHHHSIRLRCHMVRQRRIVEQRLNNNNNNSSSSSNNSNSNSNSNSNNNLSIILTIRQTRARHLIHHQVHHRPHHRLQLLLPQSTMNLEVERIESNLRTNNITFDMTYFLDFLIGYGAFGVIW